MSNRISLFRLLKLTINRQPNRLIKIQFKYENLKYFNYLLIKSLINKFNKKLFKSVELLSIGFVLMASSTEETNLLKQVDELYDQNKFDEIEKLLNNPDLLEKSDKKHEFKWRLARSRYGQVKEKQRNESELDDIRDLVLSSLEDCPECGPAHKVEFYLNNC